MNETAPVQKQDIDRLKSQLVKIIELLEEFLELARNASKDDA